MIIRFIRVTGGGIEQNVKGTRQFVNLVRCAIDRITVPTKNGKATYTCDSNQREVCGLLFRTGVDELETAYFFLTGDGGTAAVRGEPLEWLHDEARRRGVTVEEVWRVMLGQGGDKIWRILEKD